MQNDHHWLQMRNMRRMEERVRVRLRRRIVPDRSNPFEDLAEEEFLLRFRLSKECCPIPQHLQVLIALRCMATGEHQLTISDCYGVSQTSVSKCLRTVTPIIAQMARDYVKMPTGLDVIRVMEGFRDIAVTVSEMMDWEQELFDDWDYLDDLEAAIDALDGARRRPHRIVTDRMNPFTSMSDDEFVDRFRLRKVSVVTLFEEISLLLI
ncbi:hypothetical protein Pmani_024842 [Petrolisthes manimaculis]|uniref:Nuclease HARBI1 n=1 Tax=Petrolisthes manimaculis TaxID=1843537 RepID=A0AAE1P9H2_9EUCA|nr:hypothetical protein Pmani_024842 [Petrolisthes manimaculis]